MREITPEQIGQFIPLDKSWVIRMGILDLTIDYQKYSKDIKNFLDSQTDLGSDLKALGRVVEGWPFRKEKPLDIGESGTIYRFVKFYNWLNGIKHAPIISGTLIERSKNSMTNNSDIINWSPEKVLELDHKTSQWATMQYLLESKEKRRKVKNPPYKLKVTYDAVEHWELERAKGQVWVARKDVTFLNQAMAFINGLKTGAIKFEGEQAEDFCFENAFGLISIEEGKKKYPSVEGHEVPRFDEMRRVVALADKEGVIDSKDHRVVQAMVMRQIFLKKPYTVKDPDAVNKTWPRFWDFIEFVNSKI